MTLKLKHGAFPDGRLQLDLCPDCALEFRTWLGNRVAALGGPVESATSDGDLEPGPTRRGSRTTIGL